MAEGIVETLVVWSNERQRERDYFVFCVLFTLRGRWQLSIDFVHHHRDAHVKLCYDIILN